MARFRTVTRTIKGRRSSNQDACISLKLKKNSYLLAIADGMGGSAGGEIASRLAIESLKNNLKKVFKKKVNPLELKKILKESFSIIQNCLHEEVRKNPHLKGMGTTLAVVLFHNQSYVWGNLGDSRIYLLSDGELKQLTEDHSYINDYLKTHKGKLSEGIISQYGNYVTKIVDGGLDEPDVFPESRTFEKLNKGDLFLLCSDGLILDKTKTQSEIFLEILHRYKSLKRRAKHLIKWAYEEGSDDNISVVLGSAVSVDSVPVLTDHDFSEDELKTILIDKDNPVS